MAETSMLVLWIQQSALVQGVLLLLLVMSIVSWALIVQKWVLLGVMRRDIEQGETWLKERSSGNEQPQAPEPADMESGCLAMFLAAFSQMSVMNERGDMRPSLVLKRMRLAVEQVLANQLGRVDTGMSFLATVSSASPYLGLLGTVWGIINVFDSLANVHEVSLVQVAPGIAQALVATGAGLIAALPALFAYNAFRNRAEEIEDQYVGYADQVLLYFEEKMLDNHVSASTNALLGEDAAD